MELPKKPALEHEYKNGQHGELIVQLTPESEILWSNYLRELNLARVAIYNASNRNYDNTSGTSTSPEK